MVTVTVTVTERAEATGLAPSTSLYRIAQAKKPRLSPGRCDSLKRRSGVGVE